MFIRSFSLIAIFIIYFIASPVFAGYAMLKPPAPLVLQPGGLTTVPYANIAAANAPRIAGGHVLANASLNLGARTIVVPVALRVAANASVFAATKLNPYVAAASLAYGAWQLFNEWSNRDTYLSPLNPNASPLDVSDSGHIVEYPEKEKVPFYKDWVTLNPNGTTSPIKGPIAEYSCTATYGRAPQVTLVMVHSASCDAGSASYYYVCNNGWNNGRFNYSISTGCVVPGNLNSFDPSSAVSASPFRLANLANAPISASLLPFLSPDIPVDPIPIINPLVEPVGDPLIGPDVNPAPVAQPSPMNVPNGQAVPMPNTNPQTYLQPWHHIVPSPTPAEPWRVEIIQVVTVENQPIQDSPFIQQETDCDKYPNSFACALLGDPEDDQQENPKEGRNILLLSGSGFSGAACPANLVISSFAHSFQVFDSSVACGWIRAARPVILLLAALSALTIVRPGGNKVRPVSVDD